eukprot:TRINITY_DN41984_c0_g1_i1.p3 TRINITY_DN41984_c0_g1~~TRINITY_DN41984_c0_g1_i1.p3  ORF type:complete len:103 (-),score=10.59 TRINITY_DN41984_c0_g1_i1:241-549(-)
MSSVLTSALRRAATQPKPVAFRTPMAVNLKRGMAGDEGTPKYGAAKSFKEAWLSDKGAWPVMGVIGFAVSFVTYWSLSTLLTNPDVRINRTMRETVIRPPRS